ncbi:MAG: tetratricopeptide repeat protein [Candidatus Thiodiazotropha sp.]
MITKILKSLLIVLSAYSGVIAAVESLPQVVFKSVDISDESSSVIRQLVRSGAKSVPTDPVKARDLFIEALYKVDRGLDIGEYEYLWIQYGLLKSSFEPGTAQFNVGTKADYINIAAQVLNFLDESTSTGIWQYTELGQFQMEVYRTAGNGLAWQQLQNGSNQEQWKEALTTVEKAVSYIRDPEDYYILDTKVRILLKLNREQEAYRIVREVLDEDPAFADFQDLKDSLPTRP